jgi:hypothetical protein
VGTYQYNPSGAGWTFSALSGVNGSGIAANSSAFTIGNPPAPQGFQVAFLQGTGSFSQTLFGLIAGAIYQVTFVAAQRNNIYGAQAGQSWQLLLDGNLLGMYAPPQSATNYANYAVTFTAAAAPSHTLAFVGSNTNGGDNTVFIDNVQLSLLPAIVAPQLSGQFIGGQLQVAWPADHAGWTLQVQTNSLNSTNWSTLLGTALTNQFFFPLNSTDESMFFRLAYP